MRRTICSCLLGLALGVGVLVACDGGGDSLPMVDCGATIPSFAQVTALSTTCSNCHASNLSGGERNGAPSSVNFDTYAAAMTNAERAVVRVNAGTMPPGGLLSTDEKNDLYLWALCGTPP